MKGDRPGPSIAVICVTREDLCFVEELWLNRHVEHLSLNISVISAQINVNIFLSEPQKLLAQLSVKSESE
jgi:hypothetical protein